ncbi:MAG: TIGR00645 family protein [Geminicoccaceae bacterium]|nr:TIGR00645 family protein [Geminicoccaceae bacterium]MCX7628801.1 TIGR00645 family protein [Geminicoccaceae bacterium]
MEKQLERLIFASRWLMAPFYVGLVAALALLLVKFVQELVHYLPGVLAMKESDLVLAVLALVDLTLVGSLVLMVIFSGYENFVSKIDAGSAAERPDWMGKLDFSGLKLKLVASIVAISAIHLLKAFMNVSAVSKEDIFWLVVVHMAFVVSGVLLALMDWVSEKAKSPQH